MKTNCAAMASLAMALLAMPALPAAAAADAGKAEALAKKHNCLQCHALDKKILGPAYREVAKKYKGRKDAQALLVKNVRGGAKGTWGVVPMPPNDKLTEAEAALLVEWILAM